LKRRQNLERQRGKFRAAVIDDLAIHRAQDALGNIRRSRDLNEVLTATVGHHTGSFSPPEVPYF
jgi:hypothetical protein